MRHVKLRPGTATSATAPSDAANLSIRVTGANRPASNKAVCWSADDPGKNEVRYERL
jgi:hypothetical protein